MFDATSNKNLNIPNELLSVSGNPQQSLNKINAFFVDVGRILAGKAKHKNSNSPPSDNNTTPFYPTELYSLALDDTDETMHLALFHCKSKNR